MNCIICDDESLSVRGIKNYIREIPFLEMKASFSDAMALGDFLRTDSADLLLLDIEMPGRTGIEFLKLWQNVPLTILITAYPNFALQGYELNVIDYLLKPVSFERFTQAVEKARDYKILKDLSSKDPSAYFFIKTDGRFERIYFDEILFVKGMRNYVTIQTSNRKFITHTTLSALFGQMPPGRFVRTHKSFVVSKEKVKSFNGSTVVIENHSIPISRNFKASVLNCFSDVAR